MLIRLRTHMKRRIFIVLAVFTLLGSRCVTNDFIDPDDDLQTASMPETVRIAVSRTPLSSLYYIAYEQQLFQGFERDDFHMINTFVDSYADIKFVRRKEV